MLLSSVANNWNHGVETYRALLIVENHLTVFDGYDWCLNLSKRLEFLALKLSVWLEKNTTAILGPTKTQKSQGVRSTHLDLNWDT